MRSARTQDCVIGSGAGGGVLAQRLATAGRAVVLVEEGPRVGRADFNQREGDMYGLLFRDGGSQMTHDGSISVLQGRCLGGSTTVNQGDCVPISDAVLDHWRQHHGWGDWGGITNADVHAAARAVMADMGAGPIPEVMVNRNNRLLREGAEKLGLKGHVLQHNRLGCVGDGTCMIGCPHDAKRGTLVAHIPRALAAGCELWADSRVDRVVHSGGRATAVVGEGFEIEAERVFLCAGPIHSCGILLRSGLDGAALGANLSLQPQSPIVAMFDDDVVLFRGVPQSYGVDGLELSVEHGLRGMTIEGIAAGPAMSASMLPVDAAELRGLLGRFGRMAASLCLVPDRPGGRVRWGKGSRPKIEYQQTDANKARMREALKTAARCYLAAGATEVILPSPGAPRIRGEDDLVACDRLPLRSADMPLISAHPQGTCRMAGDGHEAVVGLDFRVRGTDNLYLCDASLFPTTASTHTMVPTMSLAHILAAGLGGA